MDHFYNYSILYIDSNSDTKKEDRGIVYSIKGNFTDAIRGICEDYGIRDDSNIIKIQIENIYEDGAFTVSYGTLKHLTQEFTKT